MTTINPVWMYRKPAVKSILCIASSTVYDHQKKGLITPAVSLGPKARGWPSSEIDAILNARIAGKSEDEIKNLVITLTAARQQA